MKTTSFQYRQNRGWIDLDEAKKLDSDNSLVLAFSSPLYRDEKNLISDLKQHFPKSIVIGCSTSGEILGEGIYDLSLSCTIIKLEQSRMTLVTSDLTHPSQSSYVGTQLASRLKDAKSHLKGVFVLSDGLIANGSALTQGLNGSLAGVPITGGLAGDGNHFKNTWVHVQGEIRSQMVLAVGFYGDSLEFHTSSQGGWDIFGPERVITRSVDNVVFEIDGRPALELYKEYLGDQAQGLPASGLLFPLQIRKNVHEERRLVRTILAVDEEKKSLIFAGNLPQGHLAQLMRANFDRVIDASAKAGEEIKNQNKEDVENSVCIAVSCVGRRLVLGKRSEEEVEALFGSLPAGVKVVGFYSYGELAPFQQGSACDLHNQSMTLTHIYERSSSAMAKVG